MSVATGQPETRRAHPDIFTPEEAAAYLHLDGADRLEHCRTKFGLVGYAGIGKAMMYWRDDLDVCARKMFGRDSVMEQSGRLKIAGQRG